MPAAHPSSWLFPRPEGLYCEPGDFFIDPVRAVERAVITHGHGDHARPGHAAVLATPETLGDHARPLWRGGRRAVAAAPPMARSASVGGVAVSLRPGRPHPGLAPRWCCDCRGAAPSSPATTSGAPDPTCAPFEPVRCDVFITEATFGLPVFRHPTAAGEIAKLLHRSVAAFPSARHLVGVYALGKCQRLIALLRAGRLRRADLPARRAAGAVRASISALGIELGALRPSTGMTTRSLAGAIVLCPPSAPCRTAGRAACPIR